MDTIDVDVINVRDISAQLDEYQRSQRAEYEVYISIGDINKIRIMHGIMKHKYCYTYPGKLLHGYDVKTGHFFENVGSMRVLTLGCDIQVTENYHLIYVFSLNPGDRFERRDALTIPFTTAEKLIKLYVSENRYNIIQGYVKYYACLNPSFDPSMHIIPCEPIPLLKNISEYIMGVIYVFSGGKHMSQIINSELLLDVFDKWFLNYDSNLMSSLKGLSQSGIYTLDKSLEDGSKSSANLNKWDKFRLGMRIIMECKIRDGIGYHNLCIRRSDIHALKSIIESKSIAKRPTYDELLAENAYLKNKLEKITGIITNLDNL